MALWTPANLSVAPKLILDATAVPWSGSNYATAANSGSVGGNWVVDTGTVVKGTQINALDTIAFTGAQILKLSPDFQWEVSDPNIFCVIRNINETSGDAILGHGWGHADEGFVVYPKIHGAFAGPPAWGDKDTLFFGRGYNLATYNLATLAWIGSTGNHIWFGRAGVSSIQRLNGTPATVRKVDGAYPGDTTTTITVIGGSSDLAGGNPEYGKFELAYIAFGTGWTQADIEQLEGWAAWKYNLVALLPAGHPYKSAAPTTGLPGITGPFATTENKDAVSLTGSVTTVALGAVYLDPTKLGPNISLSNANLTATQNNNVTGNTRANAHHTSGMYYCEFRVDVQGSMQVGLCSGSLPLTEFLGQTGLMSIGVDSLAGWLGAGGVTTAPLLITGHVYGLAINITLGLAWCKDITAGGLWNMNATANPATATGGATFFTSLVTTSTPPILEPKTVNISIPENSTAVVTVSAYDPDELTPPHITSPATVSIPENTTTVITVTAV